MQTAVTKISNDMHNISTGEINSAAEEYAKKVHVNPDYKGFREYTIADFKAGAEWQKQQTADTDKQGLRWVKASERLPEEGNPQSLQGKIKRDAINKVTYDDRGVVSYDATTMYYEGRNDDLYVDFKRLEWLNEP